MKKCPFCAEEIQDEAIKCRYCGEMLEKATSVEAPSVEALVKQELIARGKISAIKVYREGYPDASLAEAKDFVESLERSAAENLEEPLAPASSGTIIRHPETSADTTKCPYCLKEIDIRAKFCPYCTKNVALHTLEKRDPKGFGWGTACSAIAFVLGCVIHWKPILEVVSWAPAPGQEGCFCCYFTAFGAIMIPFMYAGVGFWVGYGLYKMTRSG